MAMEGLVRQMGIGVGWELEDQGLIEANQATDGLVDSAEDAESSMDELSDAGEQSGNRLSRSFEGFTERLKNGIDTISDMKLRLAGLATAGSAALFGAVNQAGSMEERLNTLNREFGASSQQIEDWAGVMARSTELTEMQLIDWSATLGINLRMLELTSHETANLTQEMIELTHDYAHFMDMEPEQAFQSIHQAIRGGRFPRALRDLTGQINRTDIENRALTEGLIEQGDEMDQQTERIATLSLLQEELEITQGAAADGQNEWNTRLSDFRGLLGDITRDVGIMFLPTFGRALVIVNGFLRALRDNRLLQISAGFLAITTAIAGLGAGIGILTKIGSVIGGLITTGATFFGISTGGFALILSLIPLVLLAIEDLWVGFQGGESAIFDFIGWLGEIIPIADEIISIFKGLGNMIIGALTFDLDRVLEGYIELRDAIGSIIMDGIEAAIDLVPSFISDPIIGLLSDDNGDRDEVEREASRTQNNIDRRSRVERNDYDIDISIDGSDSPQEAGRAVRRELDRYLRMEAAEAGVN